MHQGDLEGKESECWLHETRERMMGRGLIEEEARRVEVAQLDDVDDEARTVPYTET